MPRDPGHSQLLHQYVTANQGQFSGNPKPQRPGGKLQLLPFKAHTAMLSAASAQSVTPKPCAVAALDNTRSMPKASPIKHRLHLTISDRDQQL